MCVCVCVCVCAYVCVCVCVCVREEREKERVIPSPHDTKIAFVFSNHSSSGWLVEFTPKFFNSKLSKSSSNAF